MTDHTPSPATDGLRARLSRLRCRIFGHRWVRGYGYTMPFAPIDVLEVCGRSACRGRRDATRRIR